MIQLDTESVMHHLKQLGYAPTYQEETKQIYILIKQEKLEFPLFFKIDPDKTSLQMVLFFPMKVKNNWGDIARYLHYLNKEIDLPGFGMDETMGVIFYRATLLAEDGACSNQQFEGLLISIPRLASLFLPPIALLVQGSATYDVVTKRTRELMNKIQKEMNS